ncbi:MAG: TIGR03905 family TSCPD domain-containing protein [Lachnospiraceae bacterium]
MTYKPSGVCSKEIQIELCGDRIKEVCFVGGCNGNLKGIGVLVEGMKTQDAIEKLKGITCGTRQTSCPDQLAKALESLIIESN